LNIIYVRFRSMIQIQHPNYDSFSFIPAGLKVTMTGWGLNSLNGYPSTK
jgi:hypothetical protein